jgi:hypothetical protein
MKLTAMQKLKNRLIEIGFKGIEPFMNEFIAEEKQQIIDAFNDASLEGDKIGNAYYELEFKTK